jgi:hypothetical protein
VGFVDVGVVFDIEVAVETIAVREVLRVEPACLIPR